MMILTPLLTVVLASLARFTSAQSTRLDGNGDIEYDAIHNRTTIVGTWTTGSRAVTTGPAFCDPAKLLFKYPANTGVSYSFTDDGFYEVARYRFNSNGSEPSCITGVMVWAHGTYSLNSNGSITLTPFGDGFQQIQDPCAAVSNFIETYNHTEYYQGWRIFQDAVAGYKLHLFEFDGRPVAPMFLVSPTPEMFPTQLLRNNTFVTVSRRSVEEPKPKSSATRDASSRTALFLGASALVVTAFASLAL